MESNEILAELNSLFKKVFENETVSISYETTAQDVEGWDSLSHSVMISEAEKHFGVKFKLKEMLGFKNVGDLVRTIHSKQNGS